jgi:hypothetical protein
MTDHATSSDVQRSEDHIIQLLEAHMVEEGTYRRLIERRIEQNEALIVQNSALIAAQTAEVVAMKMMVERYRGALGLILILGSAVGTAILFFKESLLGVFK